MAYKFGRVFVKNFLDEDVYFQKDTCEASDFLKDLTKIRNKKILITGGTGLIGRELVYTLAKMNVRRNANIKIILLSRNANKAKKLFKSILNNGLVIQEANLVDRLNYKGEKIDFLIHAAADTNSRDMVNHPIKVINSIYKVTKNILDYCIEANVKRLVYLSSMEVYGTTSLSDGIINEDFKGRVDFNSLRSSYPESKRLTELLVRSYSQKYKFESIILRPTQVFGPGVFFNDKRVFADFTSSALKNHSITLKTKGETIRSYIYIKDAITAILQSLLIDLGESYSDVYNVSNENATISIFEMAKKISEIVGQCEIVFQKNNFNEGYAPTLQMKLSSQKLMNNSDWIPTVEIDEMLIRLVASMRLQYLKE